MVTLGVVASAHGVRGQFKVKSFTVLPSDVAAYGPVHLDDGRVLQLTVKSVAKNLVICEANGITDRSMAESLRGQTVSVERARLPDLDETQTYHADLIGLGVQDTSGQQLGIVVGLHDFGAGEIVEISLAGSNKTELYPFYPPFLVDLDIQEGKIVLVKQPASDDKGPDKRADGDD